jgi:hypothetical protein
VIVRIRPLTGLEQLDALGKQAARPIQITHDEKLGE